MSESFGAWDLQWPLGRNELGETHLALRRSDRFKAVIKRFSPNIRNDPALYEALKAELQHASELRHPAAAAVLEQGEVDGVAYAALEYMLERALAFRPENRFASARQFFDALAPWATLSS